MTLAAVLRRMKVDAVPHGFRSTFRDRCPEQTEYPNEVAEMALAQAVGDKVEAAYRRGDLLEKRVQQMKDWPGSPTWRKGQLRTKESPAPPINQLPSPKKAPSNKCASASLLGSSGLSGCL